MTLAVGVRRMTPPWPLIWTLWGLSVRVSADSGSSVSPILLNTTPVPATEYTPNVTDVATTPSNYTGLSCVSLLPPRRGSFYVESGTGVSLGSVLVFWCREGYQLVGSEKIACIIRAGIPQWSNYLPVCEAIPRPEDRGLRVAVLVSVVSGIVILAMSVSFIICCLQERLGKEREHRRDSRTRKREKQRSSSRRGACWLEREDGDWDAFPPPKIFHLSHRLPTDSPHYVGGYRGYENRGYQRSQESLLKGAVPGLYCTENQVYPHMVLQRVPTPTAPVYLHLPAQSTEAPPPPQVMSAYANPAYHSSPHDTPHRPWP
ncbi:sushi domain-containing protein 3 [Megalops cyprinoides]|uniref:sushi domain-containing protein 3 n=1 Tax=Megalops cyprinoides TaxID=118141 RepID=UPI0018641BDD|nr:sushi domain-containing protein 3 [Megalops cyprinoides]